MNNHPPHHKAGNLFLIKRLLFTLSASLFFYTVQAQERIDYLEEGNRLLSKNKPQKADRSF